MEAAELARWTRFAAKGGIGKCTAVSDCVAENVDDLMFMKDDEITVLMQLPELTGAYLGYCEGVVGRFNSTDVHFHSRLKKPVMAKRSSVNASTSKSPPPQAPSPMGKADSPAPAQPRRVRVSLDEQISASIAVFTSSSSSQALGPPDSVPIPVPTAEPGVLRLGRGSFGLNVQREEQGRWDFNGIGASSASTLAPARTPSHQSSASTSTLVESPVPLSPPYATSTAPNERESYALPAPAHDVRSSYASSRHTSVLSSYSQATATDDDHVPHPMAETATTTFANVTPAFASPPPPPPPVSPPLATPASTTTATSPPTASTAVPDTSTSTFFDSSRLSLASSDGETGIGLSLLQDLADGGSYDGWSDSDSDSNSAVHRRSTSKRGTITQPGGPGPVGGRVGAWRTSVRASAVSEESRYSHAGSSDEGLGYEDTETGHTSLRHSSHIDDELEADITQTQAAFHNLDAAAASSASSSLRGSPAATQLTFPPVAPLSPSRSRFPQLVQARPLAPAKGADYEYQFPAVPTHTPGLSLSLSMSHRGSSSSRTSGAGFFNNPFSSSPPSMSALNANAPPSDPDTPPPPPPLALDERRPSLARSTTSTSTSAASVTTATSSDWDGAAAADIYDDYRYSRFSMGGASVLGGGGRARTSFASSKFGGAGEGIPPFVDDPQARERADSISTGTGTGMGMGMGRPSVDSQASVSAPGVRTRSRSRSNATAGLGPVPALASLPPVGAPPPPPPPPPAQVPLEPLPPPLRPLAALHARPDSRGGGSESDASSVYTQPSPFVDGSFPNANANASVSVSTVTIPSKLPASLSGAGNRPAPLNLGPHDYQRQNHGAARSPLLHTTWGSPLSSPQPHVTAHGSVPTTTGTSNSTSTSTIAALNNAAHTRQGSPPSPPSSTSNTGYTGTGEGFRVGGGMPASATFFPAHLGPEQGKAKDGGGLASAMRQRLEVERKPSVEVPREEEHGVLLGRGRRIVVEDDEEEDEDEVVIGQEVSMDTERGGETEEDGDVSVETVGSGGRMVLHEAPSLASSPEPEPAMLAKGKLEPGLVVANRSPSASSGEEEKEKEKEKFRPVEATPPVFHVHAQGVGSTASVTPSTTTSTLRPPRSSSSPAPTSSHLRPSLHELRPAGQGQRQSLFLPHPNAPKAPSAHSPGPMYIAQQQPPPHAYAQSQRGGATQTIRMALAGQGPPAGPRGRGPTIYGITTEDLSAATGPVLMQFSVNPPPATAPPGKPPQTTTTTQVPGLIPAVNVAAGGAALQVVAPVPVQAVRRVGSMTNLDAAAGRDLAHGQGIGVGERPGSGAGGVIPRANFFPKTGGVRPRSRSFSGFQSTTAEIPLPIQRSGEEGRQSSEMPSASEIKRALSPIVQSPTTPNAPTGRNTPPRMSSLRVPSPLASSPDNAARSFKAPNSPLAQSFSSGITSVPPSPTQNRTAPHLRQISSRATLNEAPASRVSPVTRTTLPGGSVGDSPSPTPRQLQPRPSEVHNPPSVDTDAVSVHSTRSNLVSPPLGGQNSLRSKLSLPNLRRNASRQDDLPDSPVVVDTGDTLQVKDTDFELVRPNVAQFQETRTSEDSGVMSSADPRQDPKFLRPDSPAVSLTAPHSPTVVSDSSASGSTVWQPLKSSGAESESSMDAHRQREQKWMSVLSSVPAAQARKNKKVKKLLFDGVPSSVRYLVWSHLTDGKARCVPGVYSQLGGRGRVPALADVERDVQRCFVDHPQLQSTRGPVLSLMQAYLTMVPDIQYTTGLTLITGHLLLLAPEEDAFWIFVSIMDTHIRPYFSSTATQVDVDASLFSRALESIDPAVAKKMFIDLSTSPTNICRPWFTSLFVGSLPSDYLNRVWDIFLFEGVPFLFRVALALVSCCRRQVLESTSEEAVLNAILRPSPALLPSSPDALIALAFAVKLKDDDIRKQRVKLEAQVKRQTQAPRMVSMPGAISLPRT